MENVALPNPFRTIAQIFNEAETVIAPNPLAMILATADAEGRPSSRTVLLKGYDENGFVFFTNSHSRKGRQLDQNPFASLTFYLPKLKKQIQIEGRAAQIHSKESDAYWATRSRESQIGAWASAQSKEIHKNNDFKQRIRKFEQQFSKKKSIPRPSNWNGYRLSPERIEIWLEGEHRLHDRICYTKDNDLWNETHLFP